MAIIVLGEALLARPFGSCGLVRYGGQEERVSLFAFSLKASILTRFDVHCTGARPNK